jgi:acetoin utilization deacetylase AcuC-like enzyme
VLDGELDRAFCAVRPPGHHATAERAMGFCLFNNVAAAAAHAIHRGRKRVAIVDIDVHHGNGTQDIFWEDPRVLYVSSHAYPFYPGTGALDETGEGAGRGFTVNLPFPAGMGDAHYARVYGEIVVPIGKAFDPELVLVSCGFDAHRADPLAPMDLTPAGYAHLMAVCVGMAGGAAHGKVVVALEGGYLLDGIAGAGAAVVSVLLGSAPKPVEPARGSRLDVLCAAYREELAPYWPLIRA